MKFKQMEKISNDLETAYDLLYWFEDNGFPALARAQEQQVEVLVKRQKEAIGEWQANLELSVLDDITKYEHRQLSNWLENQSRTRGGMR